MDEKSGLIYTITLLPVWNLPVSLAYSSCIWGPNMTRMTCSIDIGGNIFLPLSHLCLLSHKANRFCDKLSYFTYVTVAYKIVLFTYCPVHKKSDYLGGHPSFLWAPVIRCRHSQHKFCSHVYRHSAAPCPWPHLHQFLNRYRRGWMYGSALSGV